MLDAETRRRIDSCRDILVGKVPDPKSQVEQITIALIYKFMDDMDAEAEELGGKRSFFAGEYAKYGWAKLMAPNMGGFDVLSLYSEAIGKMNENPGIPTLFRDIFKNAYLPYRDPETLRIFLKEINYFTYDHSEKLGDAFEYLLSVLGSQGDAGQFRTPRHIIDFMVEIVDPQKGERILDPACGTAGFLISAWKHILKHNTRKKLGDLLTPEQRAYIAANVHGYDISPDMVRLSLVNLYLHGFTDPHVVEYDTLTSEEKWNESADVILANPPFMSPKGGIKPHKRFSIQATRSEVLFVDYIAEHLTPNGRAAIIVPEGIIFQNGTAYKQLRQMLVKNSLVAVISLPAGIFNPYSGVKTSILLLDKWLAKRISEVLFLKVENDGFNLGAQRRAMAGSGLPDAAAAYLAFRQSQESSKPAAFDAAQFSNAHVVEKIRIGENDEWSLSGDRYRANVHDHHSDFPSVPIGEICNLLNGRAFKPEDWNEHKDGGLPIIRIQNLNNPKSAFNYFSGAVSEKNLVHNGDLLFSWSGSRGTSFGAHIWYGNNAVLNQHIFKVLFDESRATKLYLYYALNRAVLAVEENLHGGVGLVHITKGNLEKIEIPLPPLSIQKEIVAKLEGYQKIIDGARQVVEYCRPQVDVQPDWPIVNLGDVIESKPKNGYSGSPVDYPTSVKVLSLSATTSGKMNLSKFKFLDEDIPVDSPCRCRRGDIYLQRGNTKELVGTAAIFDSDESNFVYPDLMIRVRADETKVQRHYLLHILQSDSIRDYLTRNAVGAAGNMPKINQGIVERIPLPLPDLDTQRTIVAEIETEQALVGANKNLIARFEAKIKTTINSVWGNDAV